MEERSPVKPLVSIITPVYNEELNVLECYRRCREIFKTELSDWDYEHIFADNRSTDSTLELLRGLAGNDHRVKVISNSRNVGVFRNAANAMRSASGIVIIPVLAADLQDPPEVIPAFIEEWSKGNLIVFGVRKSRKESILLKLLRGAYYWGLNLAGGGGAPPSHAGEFQLLDRRVALSILEVEDHYPYIRGLAAKTGVKSSTVEYNWMARQNGASKIPLLELIDQAINGFITTARAPVRISLLLGLAASVAGIGIGIYAFLSFYFFDNDVAAGIPATLVGVFIFGGFQLLFLGLLGEYVLSIHEQVRKTPALFEIERLNFD